MDIGALTGRKDSNGVDIKCGDTVIYTQFKNGYRETHTQDGWGQTIALCRHDQRDIPDKTKDIKGVVTYSERFTGFIIEFDDFFIDSGRKSENLYIVLNLDKNEKLVVI